MPDPKLPPHSIVAEQSVVGGLLISRDAWPDVADMLRGADFYREDHRLIFEAVARLAEAGQPHDMITVTEQLRGAGQLDRVGAEYLGNLAADTPGAANIRAYAQIVSDKAMLRAMIRAGDKMVTSGFTDDGQPTADKLDAAEQALSAISQQREADTVISAREAATRSMQRMEQRLDAKGEVTGIPTGFVDYDRMTTGLQPGELTIVAGRPSMGKSAFAMQAAYSVARHGRQVVVFSLEMPPEDLNDRQISVLSGVPMEHIRSPKQMPREEWDALTPAIAQIRDLPLAIVDNANVTLRSINAVTRRAHRKKPVGLVVVDHLQLVVPENAKQRRDEQLSAITGGLKRLARELRCSVICLSQLNRQVEQREDKRPRMSDLRESGGIEQDADVIAFMYRDEVYREESPHAGIAEVIFSKQRNGPSGHIDLTWQAECVRFLNYSGPSRDEREPKKAVGQSGFAAQYRKRVAG